MSCAAPPSRSAKGLRTFRAASRTRQRSPPGALMDRLISWFCIYGVLRQRCPPREFWLQKHAGICSLLAYQRFPRKAAFRPMRSRLIRAIAHCFSDRAPGTSSPAGMAARPRTGAPQCLTTTPSIACNRQAQVTTTSRRHRNNTLPPGRTTAPPRPAWVHLAHGSSAIEPPLRRGFFMSAAQSTVWSTLRHIPR